jgi:hypothetical protein
MKKIILGVSVFLVISIGLMLFAMPGSSKQSPPSSVRTERAHTVQESPPSLEAGFSASIADLGEYLEATRQAQITQYQVVSYVVAVQNAEAETARQQQAAVQAYATAMQQARGSQSNIAAAPTGNVSGGGSCYGGPIPDYIVTRESGGNPNAQNPSGAWGCYQIMPEWWSGACSHLDKYTIDGQKSCAAILWNGGAGSSNWALTR